MKRLYTIFIFFIFLTTLNAQVTSKTKLRELPLNVDVNIAKAFTLPADTTTILLDSGKGKVCSCQFFANKSAHPRTIENSLDLSLKEVAIKGLFDGSQMHVARVYFNETDDYFKFKCYAKDILVEHVLEFLSFGSNVVVRETEKE